MRTTRSFAIMAALLACLAAACSEGVTPTCTADAGCGTKPGTDAGTNVSP